MKIATAIAALVDAHLNDRPGLNASVDQLARHARIGDKLLELLLETVEMDDAELYTAVVGAVRSPAPELEPKAAPDKPRPQWVRAPESEFIPGPETHVAESSPPDTPQERLELRERYRRTRTRSKEREAVYREALDMTASGGRWWIAEAARAIGVNINTMQQAVKRIDPSHPRLFARGRSSDGNGSADQRV